MRALATWCVRNRRSVVLLWLAVLVLVIVIGKDIGTNYSNDFSLPGTESTRAYDLLKDASPKVSGDTDQIVIATNHGLSVNDPLVIASTNKMLSQLVKIPSVSRIVTPFALSTISFDTHGKLFVSNPTQIDPEHTIAFISVTLDIPGFHVTEKFAQNFVRVASSMTVKHLNVGVAGQVAEQANRPSVGGLGIGAIAAGIVLLLVFGSLFAALMPLASALVALGTATSIIGILSNVIKMPMFAPELVLLIGLGVGVDYALFIVTRHRQGLLEGLDSESSIVQAVNTSGRAVLFAGIIVCIALLGMFAIGVSFLYGLAIAASIGVAFTMMAALTLLPAILGFVGPWILSRKQRRLLVANGPRVGADSSPGFWTRWSVFVAKRPAVPAIVALGLIAAIAVPFLSIRLGAADQGNDPVGTTTRTAYDLLAKGFGPGFNGPLQIVAVVPSEPNAMMNSIYLKLQAVPDVVQPVAPPAFIPDQHHGGFVELINVIPKSSPQDAATNALIDNIRSDVIPSVVGSSNFKVLVGGPTAIFADFAGVLGSKMPLFIGLVVLTSCLLLMVVFRSIVVPLMSAVMNLLSIGAAFGVLTAVFQWGWLGGLFGVNRAGPIEAFLPNMMFAILFGLSMDYQVFLLVRVHEEFLKSGDNKTAVRMGLARTGKTITAAAAIMIVVFGSFILGGERVIKEFGLGLAGGVLVDAIVIRMAIVPAVMFLFGKSNWWFPRFLERRIPKFGLEHE